MSKKENSKRNLDNVVRANPVDEEDLSKAEEVESESATMTELIKKARKDAKAKGKVHKVDHRKRKTGTRPHNVYKENTTDGVFIWWTTEDSKVVGKEPIQQVDELTMIKKELGYELTIPFMPEIAQEIKKQGGNYSIFYIKDGERTEGFEKKDFDKWLNHSF
jgi:hypothetical protein